jgi:hypothetical protein
MTRKQQQRNRVFCAVLAKMLQAGELVRVSQLRGVSEESWLVSD